MADGYINYQRGRDGSSGVTAALQQFQACVAVFEPLVAANPALLDEMAKPTVSNDKVRFVLDTCKARVAELSTVGSPEFQQLVAALYAASISLKYPGPEDMQRCLSIIDSALKQHPEFAKEQYFSTGMTIGEFREACVKGQATLDAQRQQKTQDALASLNKLKPNYDALMKSLASAEAMPDKTNPQILMKYRAYREMRESFDSLISGINAAIGGLSSADLSNSKVGSVPLATFLSQFQTAYKRYDSKRQELDRKSDAAFDAQDAQINATLPKLISGERLAVFKRRGIPYTWKGGPTLAKNGIYSGDGTLIAKDLAAATQWLYRENSQGCFYYYTFSKNAVVKLEKPIFCD